MSGVSVPEILISEGLLMKEGKKISVKFLNERGNYVVHMVPVDEIVMIKHNAQASKDTGLNMSDIVLYDMSCAIGEIDILEYIRLKRPILIEE